MQPASEESAAGLPTEFADEGDEVEPEAEQMNADSSPLNFL
jgi:hypothetical protein